jgi:hypothetical protein
LWTGDPQVYGETRLSANALYGLTSNSIGYDVRLGSFIGPKLDDALFQIGPDFFYNGYGGAGATDYQLPASGGVSISAEASYSPIKEATLYGTALPSWMFNPDRGASNLGPVDELAVQLGVQVRIDSFSGTLGYQWQWTAAGLIQGVVVSGGLSDFL